MSDLDSKVGVIIAAVVVVLAVIAYAVYDSSQGAPVMQAKTVTLPEGITSFSDGDKVCYSFKPPWTEGTTCFDKND